MPQFGGGSKCMKCSKSVYQSEGIIAEESSWHKRCFTCRECNKYLDSTTASIYKKDNDGQTENEVYCKACYGKQYGPKGFGYGGGAGALTNTGK